MRRFPTACGFEYRQATRGCGFWPPESVAHSSPHHAEVVSESGLSVWHCPPTFSPTVVTVRRECGEYSRRAVRLAYPVGLTTLVLTTLTVEYRPVPAMLPDTARSASVMLLLCPRDTHTTRPMKTTH
jgi:hypothetical protein